jgi:redox-sensitive bicupin YhaK (pirin superfamily)
LWVNLPARDKMMEPRYQEIPAARIPTATSDDGLAKVRVVAGEALGVSAAIETRTPIAYHHWTLAPGASVDVALPDAMRAYVYVFRGSATVGEQARSLRDGQLAVMAGHGAVRLAVPSEAGEGAELLLLAGVALDEPVAWHGPFVMNTQAEIEEAIRDYQRGRLGAIRR